MQLKKLFYISAILFTAISSLAQQVPTLGYFNISGAGKSVYLSWQLNAGATCLGMGVQRSSDGQTFEQVGKIGGICGDLTKPISYNFVDENPPVNTRLYYRIELGQGAFSDTVKIELIDLGESVVQVRPNPVRDYTKVYFKNDSRTMHTLTLSDLNGRRLGSVSTDQNFVELHLSYPPGLYIFSIRSSDGAQNYSGKLMVVH